MSGPDVSRPHVPAGQRGAWLTLAVLTLVFILANIDRNILAILLPAIQREFALADWQLGLLGGFAFSLVYGVAGIFVSDFADRGNRPWIIAVSLGVWSAMTMACGSVTLSRICIRPEREIWRFLTLSRICIRPEREIWRFIGRG